MDRAVSFGNALRPENVITRSDSEGSEEEQGGLPSPFESHDVGDASTSDGMHSSAGSQPSARRLMRSSAKTNDDEEGSGLAEELFSFKMRERIKEAEEQAEECGRSTSPTIWSSRPSSFSESFSGFSRASCHSFMDMSDDGGGSPCGGAHGGIEVVRRTHSAVDGRSSAPGLSVSGRLRDSSPLSWRARMGSDSLAGSPTYSCTNEGAAEVASRGVHRASSSSLGGRPPTGLPPRAGSGSGVTPGGGSPGSPSALASAAVGGSMLPLTPQRSGGSLRSELLRGSAAASWAPYLQRTSSSGGADGYRGPRLSGDSRFHPQSASEMSAGVDTASEQVRAHAVIYARAKGCTLEEAIARLTLRRPAGGGGGLKARRGSTGETQPQQPLQR